MSRRVIEAAPGENSSGVELPAFWKPEEGV